MYTFSTITNGWKETFDNLKGPTRKTCMAQLPYWTIGVKLDMHCHVNSYVSHTLNLMQSSLFKHNNIYIHMPTDFLFGQYLF